MWLACRHHIHELHLKRIIQGVTGQTKDPGVALFRRLKSEWGNLDIDYGKLSRMKYDILPTWLQHEAKSVLEWAEQELDRNTWPREDYRELLRLSIMVLGGSVPDFQFLLPGPDHHARWMSKAIYYLKLKYGLYGTTQLLSNIIPLFGCLTCLPPSAGLLLMYVA